jgi:hypothetical protein
MPKLVTQATVCVIREGKRVFPEIGRPFNYTDQEVARIKRVSPTALRVPVNEETATEGVADEFSTKTTDKSGEVEGGKKAAKPTANKTPKRTAKQKAAEKTADADAADDEDDDDGSVDEDATDEDEDI